MVMGEIDLLKPNENGKYKKELFEIGAEEVEELEQVIKNISRKILDLSFWDKKCDDGGCEFCRLRKVMR